MTATKSRAYHRIGNHYHFFAETPDANKPLTFFEHACPDRREAMARAFLAGVYTMREIADRFGMHCSTVSRAVHGVEAGVASTSATPRAGRADLA